jgi:adenylate cyclase class 2
MRVRYTIGTRRWEKAAPAGVSEPVARETEIKLRISDVSSFHRALERLGARLVGPGTSRVHEENVIFDTSKSALAKKARLLRIRTEKPEVLGELRAAGPKERVLLTFKQPIDNLADSETIGEAYGQYKVREELELEVADAGILARIFEGLGMKGWFRYEKYRTTFRLPDSKAWAKGLLIELDETPIGTFVELEGPAAAIDRAAEELGFSKRDYILQSYLSLYLEECSRSGEEPRHMLFSNSKSPSQ